MDCQRGPTLVGFGTATGLCCRPVIMTRYTDRRISFMLSVNAYRELLAEALLDALEQAGCAKVSQDVSIRGG